METGPRPTPKAGLFDGTKWYSIRPMFMTRFLEVFAPRGAGTKRDRVESAYCLPLASRNAVTERRGVCGRCSPEQCSEVISQRGRAKWAVLSAGIRRSGGSNQAGRSAPRMSRPWISGTIAAGRRGRASGGERAGCPPSSAAGLATGIGAVLCVRLASDGIPDPI